MTKSFILNLEKYTEYLFLIGLNNLTEEEYKDYLELCKALREEERPKTFTKELARGLEKEYHNAKYSIRRLLERKGLKNVSDKEYNYYKAIMEELGFIHDIKPRNSEPLKPLRLRDKWNTEAEIFKGL